MSQVLSPDSYGRTIEFSTDGAKDIYVVKDSDGVACITIKCPIGKPRDQVYYTINGLAPSNVFVPPGPLNIEQRVEDLEQKVDVVQSDIVDVKATVTDLEATVVSANPQPVKI